MLSTQKKPRLLEIGSKTLTDVGPRPGGISVAALIGAFFGVAMRVGDARKT